MKIECRKMKDNAIFVEKALVIRLYHFIVNNVKSWNYQKFQMVTKIWFVNHYMKFNCTSVGKIECK